MGGTGGGGSFSSKDMSKIQEAAEERLRALASKSTKVLFVCEALDKKALDALLSKSSIFPKERVVVVDSSEAAKVDSTLDGISFLVCFTDAATSTTFIDAAIDKVTAKKIGGVHVKAHSKSIIPSKISAYRMRSISWRELEAIFK
jgi:hypothetical protein